ncbi:MAG TPA: ABC transporter permease [Dehalococcoidia bacterium]|nr:ABC transporter permease [Dehalococcoidia bacterium]
MRRAALGALAVQLQISRRNVMDYYWILLVPFFALIFMAVLVDAGRKDLLGYAVVGPLLIGVGQMGFYVASEVVTRDLSSEVLELEIATPAPFPLIIAARTILLTSMALIGFIESWLLAWVVFDVRVPIHHPSILLVTLVVTTFAAGATALITTGLFSLNKSARSMQNTVTYPLYLLAGVLVPVTFLPDWVEPVSRLLFQSWSADLLRDSISQAPVDDLLPRLLAIAGLGLAALASGSLILTRMVDHLRRDGRLGL